jgi:hypothetical protein
MSIDISEIRQKIGRLSKERLELERKILDVLSRKSLLKGSFVRKYKACNKKGCRCTKGELHGPFFYLSLRRAGKTRMIFVKKRDWSIVEELSANYRAWRQNRAKIARINRQILALIDQMEGERILGVSFLEESSEKRREEEEQ